MDTAMGFSSRIFGKTETNTEASMTLVDRGEYLVWTRGDHSTGMAVTWHDGFRIYPTAAMVWSGTNEPVGEPEMLEVFGDMLRYLNRDGSSPTVVIDADDPMANQWEAYCNDHRELTAGIERTSREMQLRAEYDVHIEWLKTGKQLSINGTEIRTVDDLKAFYAARGYSRNR
jgi:hypothetical protein